MRILSVVIAREIQSTLNTTDDAQCSESEGDAGTCTTGGDDQGGKDLQQVHVHVGGIAHQEKEEYMEGARVQ